MRDDREIPDVLAVH